MIIVKGKKCDFISDISETNEKDKLKPLIYLVCLRINKENKISIDGGGKRSSGGSNDKDARCGKHSGSPPGFLSKSFP